jgi:hypothetical protein
VEPAGVFPSRRDAPRKHPARGRIQALTGTSQRRFVSFRQNPVNETYIIRRCPKNTLHLFYKLELENRFFLKAQFWMD